MNCSPACNPLTRSSAWPLPGTSRLPPCLPPAPQAQQRAADAVAREVAASKQLLAKEAEVGALKGEISMLRTQVRPGAGAGGGAREGRSARVRT